MNPPPPAPRPWLRNGHLQSVLSSSALRRWRGQQRLRQLGARTHPLLLDGGDGVRLKALHSFLPQRRPRALALLLHGWEGSAESGYMRQAAASLLAAGADVVRLNFRDHGGTLDLNPGLFHSVRIGEVVQAACDVARRFDGLPLVAGGYSLGGNFALRLGLHGPAAGLPLQRIAAVCPVVDPARTMDRFEQDSLVYARYFHRKWTATLRRKRALFPQQMADCTDQVLAQDMRALTDWLARRYAGFADADSYFDAYSIAGERIAPLTVPASVLMAADDPVIPLEDFRQWPLPAHSQLEILPWGGHCGFLHSLRGDGWSEDWMARRLLDGIVAGT